MISILSIVIVLIFTLDTTTTEIVRKIRPEYLLAALGIHMLSFIIWGLRTKSMASALGHKIGIITALEIVISSTFVAAITPSSIGGEPLRIHLLSQNQMPIGKATAVVLGERLLDAILILLIAPFSLLLFHGIMSNPTLDIVLISGELLLIVSLIFVLYAVLRPHNIKLAINVLVGWIARLGGKKTGSKLSKLSESIDREMEEFHNSMHIFFTEGRKGLFYGSIYTVIFWIVEFSLLPVILLGLNQAPSVMIAFAAQAILMIILIVPLTPGSSGIAEFSAITLFSFFVPANALGITVAAWRAFTFYINLLVGGFVCFKLLKNTEMIQKYIK
ncbi:Integral membrane protein [Methanosarcina lacustris Z-7289]|uniref:Integral membrane protein n=1 Tax=Methanosarcina lacustris Z-7289 TaxID=1434111 RepID=A0A0E3S3V3_9EURY|nr:Integral membrane protein [Methanosarcina lacustris Z-7289]